MGYCKQCGKEIGENLKFCPYCGTPEPCAGVEPGSAGSAGTNPGNAGGYKGGGAGRNKALIFGIIGAAALLIIIALVVGLNRKTVLTPSDFIEVSFTGADGYGNVQCSFNSTNAMLYLKDKMKMEPKEEIAIANQLYYIDAEASKYYELSNGEKIEVVCNIEPESLEKYGIKIKNEAVKVKVSGLKEMEDVDGTELLTVNFSGANPRVQVELVWDSENPLYSYIDWNELYNLPQTIQAKNGDTYTVEIPYVEQNALYNGYRITNNIKEFEISGVGDYDYALEDMDEEDISPIITEGLEYVRTYLPGREGDILDELSGSGGRVLWSKMKCAFDKAVKCYCPDGYYAYNKNAFVYAASLPVLNRDESVSVHTVYVPYYIENIQKQADGTFSYEDSGVGGYCCSEEALQSELDRMPEALGAESESCTVAERVNEDAASEIQQESFDAPEEVPVEYTEPEAPVLPDNLAAAAIAEAEFNGHRYYLFDENIAWTDAKAACEEKGGHLATVTGWTEQSVLNSLREQGELGNYWIGATDAEMEGSWKWVTGETFDYSCWEDDEPNNSGGAEHCAALFGREDGDWGDLANDTDWETGYILELEPETDVNDDGVVLSDCDLLTEQKESHFVGWSEDTYGRRYYGPFALNADKEGWAGFNLEGRYTRMTGKICVYSEAANGASIETAFFGDGKLLGRRCVLDRLNQGEPFEIDLTGVNTLTVAASNTGETGGGWILLSNLRIYGGGEKGETEVCRLNDVHSMGSSSVETASELWRDSDGVLHDGYKVFYTHEDAGAAWYLNGEYTEFSAKLAGYNSSPDVKMNVRIYGDEDLLYEVKDWNRMQEGISFTADVTGKKILRVETDEGSGNYDAFIYLTDDRLVKAAETSGTEAAVEETADTEENVPVLNAGFAPAAQAAYDGHYYYLFKQEMDWGQAEAFCEEMGGHLAVITSPLEQRRVEQLIEKGDGDGVWIGGTDEGHEGSWTWVTGEEFDYTHWRSGQPDNYQHGEEFENHMEVYWDGEWNDQHGAKPSGFILEISYDKSRPKDYLELAELFNLERVPENSSFEYKDSATDVKGNRQFSAYKLDSSSNGYANISLNGEFTRFTGKIANSRENEWNDGIRLGVFGDGKCLYEKTEYRGWEAEEKFDIDVTGVKTLTIRCSTMIGHDYGYLLLYDTKLEKAGSPSLNEQTTALAAVQQIDSIGFEGDTYLFRDSINHVHDGKFIMDTDDESYAIYLIEGRYTEFTGMFTAGKDTEYGDSIRVEVYGDDELLFEQSGITKITEPVTFAVDVTGKSKLRIAAYDETERSRGIVYLTDARLK